MSRDPPFTADEQLGRIADAAKSLADAVGSIADALADPNRTTSVDRPSYDVVVAQRDRLRAAINIDRSGLGRGLDGIHRLIRDVIPHTQDEDTGEVTASLTLTLRTIDEIAMAALKSSGDLAHAAIRGEPHADLDAALTLTLTPREVQCLAKCAATYSLLRSTEGKPTSIIDGIAARIPKVPP